MSLILLNGLRPRYSYHPVPHLLNQLLGDISDFSVEKPETSDDSKLDVAKDLQIVNDRTKFAVSMNVSNFQPDQLKANLEDRTLTIEGLQEEETEQGYCKRSFIRKWQLPEDVDADQIESTISEDGQLQIVAKKRTGPNARNIPIMSKQ